VLAGWQPTCTTQSGAAQERSAWQMRTIESGGATAAGKLWSYD
jgi:hypothetical protein